MFAKPRVKKSTLPPPSKKRKTTSAIEEINFDFDARQEYLTGFHKRKQERIKNAQAEAAKRARAEKLETRKEIREQRRREIEEHVETVNKMLIESGAVVPDIEQNSDGEEVEEWGGFPDRPDDDVNLEEEYVDEDRYTTVTIESVNVSRDGLSRPELPKEEPEEEANEKEGEEEHSSGKKWPKKVKKKKFRYESKIDRQAQNLRQKARNKAKRSG